MINVAEIYSNNYNALLMFSNNITKSHHLAEDAVSELFKKINSALNRKCRFNSTTQLHSYIYKALRGCCYTLMKKESRYLSLDSEDSAMLLDEKDALKETSDHEEQQAILKLLMCEVRKLPPKQRQAIKLRYFSGDIMPTKEIARRTKSNDSAVGFLISKAKSKLKNRLVAKWQTQQT